MPYYFDSNILLGLILLLFLIVFLLTNFIFFFSNDTAPTEISPLSLHDALPIWFHAAVMEPWDGPACVAFTDGTLIGAVLDRNGLRPSRYWVTHDGLVILASEVGVLDIDPANVARKGRLQPGRIFLADTASRRILEDGDVKAALAAEHPYQDWLHAGLLHLDDLPDRERKLPGGDELTTLQLLAGYTEEELRVLLAPMARAGAH